MRADYNGTMYFNVSAGRTQLLALDLYSTYDSGYTDVTNTITNLEYYGWIRNASVSADGTTLTLTKWNGSTINFNKAGSALSSLTLESVSGSASSFKAVAYDSSYTVLDYTAGEVYLDDNIYNYNRDTWACVRPSGGSRIAYTPLSGYWDAAQAAVSVTGTWEKDSSTQRISIPIKTAGNVTLITPYVDGANLFARVNGYVYTENNRHYAPAQFTVYLSNNQYFTVDGAVDLEYLYS